jgi:hypothetical protein
MTSVQVYSRFEIFSERRNEAKAKEKAEEFDAHIKNALRELEGMTNLSSASYRKLSGEARTVLKEVSKKGDRYLTNLWITDAVEHVNKLSVRMHEDEDVWQKRQNLINYLIKMKMYKDVIKRKKTFGEINVLAMLGVLRDPASAEELKGYEKKAERLKNVYYVYYLALAYAKCADYEGLRRMVNLLFSGTREFIDERLCMYLLFMFEGDKGLIDKWQEEMLNSTNVSQVIIAISYFRECKNASVAKRIYAILMKAIEICENSENSIIALKQQNDDLTIVALRYFEVVHFEEADGFIMGLVDNKEDKIKAQAIKCLKNFDNIKVKDILLKGINSENWYVRYNSARTSIKMGYNRDELRRMRKDENEKKE